MAAVDSSRSLGPLRLIRRIYDARRGDVRAMEDLYHLRGVLTFVAIFAATIVLPGLLLAYYGFVGIRAEQRAGVADVERQANAAADAVSVGVESLFRSFEDATLNRLKSGQSVSTGLAEMSPVLRLVVRYNADGELIGPFARAEVDPFEDQLSFFFGPLRAGQRLERANDPARAAAAYALAVRDAKAPRLRGQAQLARAGALLRAGEANAAEALFQEIAAQYPTVREAHGFRLGDLARLKLGEITRRRDPAAGEAHLRALVESLLAEPWSIGRGGEAAVARRAVDLLASRANEEWISRMRGRLQERSSQLYWAEVLLPELDTLGSRGRLMRTGTGEFDYQHGASAIWASTWTDEDQYVFALEFSGLVELARDLADRAAVPEGDVVVAIAGPDDPERESLSRRTLSPWFPGWSIVVSPRDPAGLADRQREERLRGSGIILLSIAMIGVGAFLSARLVQRELESARDKSDFAAHVSHELRSPITQIRLKAEALQLGLASDEGARARHYDVIVRESERLSRLVDNVLDFAAIERGRKKYTFRPGDLGSTVSRAVEAARVAMETRGMQIDLELPEDLPVVWHDVDAVGQCLTNLLSNAAKYGQEAAWIGVSVRAEGNEVAVSVSDRGIGIDTAEQRSVFEQYYRSSDPLARRRKGTGIGLTIVKYIMEAHGGHVSLHSVLSKGSTFTLHFPLSLPAHQSAGA